MVRRSADTAGQGGSGTPVETPFPVASHTLRYGHGGRLDGCAGGPSREAEIPGARACDQTAREKSDAALHPIHCVNGVAIPVRLALLGARYGLCEPLVSPFAPRKNETFAERKATIDEKAGGEREVGKEVARASETLAQPKSVENDAALHPMHCVISTTIGFPDPPPSPGNGCAAEICEVALHSMHCVTDGGHAQCAALSPVQRPWRAVPAGATGGRPAAHAVPRRYSSCTPSALSARTSWPSTQWNTRPLP